MSFIMSSVDTVDMEENRLIVVAAEQPEIKFLANNSEQSSKDFGAVGSSMYSKSLDSKSRSHYSKIPPIKILVTSVKELKQAKKLLCSKKNTGKAKVENGSNPHYYITRCNEEWKNYVYRTVLPVPMISRSDFSIWSILKQCIGKELSKITMPVVFNEPLSFIQRLSEYMAYAPLIEKTDEASDPIERMMCVAAFAVSALSSNLGRIGKPFNPLLGETFELNRPDLGFRYVGEQVSHHPPVTAFHADGGDYSFFGSIQPKLKFWGKTVEIIPKGLITLKLHKYNETYTWSNVNCCIHNVIVGTLWVEHYGTMEINCSSNSVKAVLHFKQAGWFGKDLHRLEGFIYNGKQKEMAIYGSWVQGLYSCKADSYEKQISDPEFKAMQAMREKEEGKNCIQNYNYNLRGQRTIWQVDPKPANCHEYYQFSLFSLSLNEILPGMSQTFPPTDSRFRPDIRHMEDGDIEKSASEKNRVEEKQRDKRKERKKKNTEWKPTWFKLQPHPITGKDEWTFNPSYLERNWKNCPDIF